MKYLLLIKGDGRGHLTQALALSQLLLGRGHTLQALVLGAPKKAAIPSFFFDKAPAPVVRLESPNFKLNKRADQISWLRTIGHVLGNLGSYRSSLRQLNDLLLAHQPDVIINLYDPLLALYCWFYKKPKAPIIHISHQGLLLHKDFEFPGGNALARRAILWYTRLVGRPSAKTLALSFYSFTDDVAAGVIPVAPLVREEVLQRTATEGAHLLVYMVYPGVAEQVKAFNKLHPEVPIKAFWNNPGQPPELVLSPTLTFHQVQDTLFLDLLASCKGVATTAGFETVCEAFYYRKPAVLLPMPGQYEQTINAFDAEKVGAGKQVQSLDPALLLGFLPSYNPPDHAGYLQWLETGKQKLIYHLENPTASAGSPIVQRTLPIRTAHETSQA